ncbi:MAG: peptidoglycan bridge formation glycyltransferase FemA/FemB family protein [Candidatus Blackburnbacteria bacterium]|nr:peptidoglycan bridge formation glycyltransferase FemA/FemB family protein [Candidatus Blackburnbacteria bacterium]
MGKTVKILSIADKKSFNGLACHPIQSWEWGDFRQESGNTIVRMGVFEGKELVQGHQLTIHKIPKTSYKLAMLLKGPLPSKKFLQFLKSYAQKEKIIFVRLEPNVTSSLESARKFLRTSGAVPGRRFFTPETFVLDLTLSEEELLKSFHPKTRYNIRLAQKHGVTVTLENSEKAFEEYLQQTEGTAKRQGFFAHTARYHKLMWKHLHSSGIAHLLQAKYRGETLVSWIVFVWRDTLYYPYGASSVNHKNVMAPNLMMWEAIKFGKSRKLKLFDLWGKEEGKGFTKFKEGYNPKVIEFVGTWDLVCNRALYPIYRAAENVRWGLLKLPLPLPKPKFR